MMQEECLVKGTPAMIAGILESRSIALEEDQQPAPGVSIVGAPLPVDALGALLKVYGRRGFVDRGTPGMGYAWLRLVQEPGGVTRLSVNCDSADWETFGLRFWYRDLRGEMARRGMLVDAAPAVITSEETTAEETDTPNGGRFGTDRDMSFDDVLSICSNVRKWQARGGKIPDWYRDHADNRYTLGTLYDWLKQGRFKKTPPISP